MIACVDVDYRASEAIAACVLFRSWNDAFSADEKVERITKVEPYEPGQFFRRELPCLLAVLAGVGEPVETVVVDGYVWLRDEQTPGLGAHLYEALGRTTPVIGVAKTRFLSAVAAEVKRGNSQRPLYVTAAGMDLQEAARHIQGMHGLHRIPTLLKRVDRLCRNAPATPLVAPCWGLAPRGTRTVPATRVKPEIEESALPRMLGAVGLEEPRHTKVQLTKAWWQFWK
jgi:deoxyribonuclease V